MRNTFVETSNVRRFQSAFSALEKRGATEACLMVVDGVPGLGKTTTVDRWVSQNGAIFVRAKAEWSAGWFLNDLLDRLSVSPAHSFERRFAQAAGALVDQQTKLVLQRRPFAVVIDEADHISRNRKVMETIRDFSDLADIPFILVGMARLRSHLTALPQIASRIAQYVRFEPADLSDVTRFVAEICEVPVAGDLTAFVATASGGFNREIKEAIASIERFGRRNGCGPDKPVTLSDMAGQVLLNDRKSGQPIHVPGGV